MTEFEDRAGSTTINYDFNDVMRSYEEICQRSMQNAQKDSEEEQFFLKEHLKQEGVQKVEITFFGAGDDGSIEDIIYTTTKGEVPRWEGTELIHNSLKQTDQRVEDYAYKFLESTGVDWVNNDGGQGTLILDVENDVFAYRIEQNETVAHEVACDVENM